MPITFMQCGETFQTILARICSGSIMSRCLIPNSNGMPREDDFIPHPAKASVTQPAAAGGPPGPPPKPPKLTARDLLEPGEPGKRIFLADYVVVKDLAELLGMKPFRVVADLLEFG